MEFWSLLFFQKADNNLKHLGLPSWWWSCQTLSQYMTPQRSVQSPASSPKGPPPGSSPLSLDSILPHWENLPLPSPLTSAWTPTGTTEARVPLVPAVRRYFDICRVASPPSVWDRGGSQRLKVKPGPSRVLQIVLHRLRLWGFGAKSYFPPFVSGDIFKLNPDIQSNRSWLNLWDQ